MAKQENTRIRFVEAESHLKLNHPQRQYIRIYNKHLECFGNEHPQTL